MNGITTNYEEKAQVNKCDLNARLKTGNTVDITYGSRETIPHNRTAKRKCTFPELRLFKLQWTYLDSDSAVAGLVTSLLLA